ncbi:Ger(x)C family spore germination protein [Bacillus sp. FJAT-45350]|uniref:Ger(x)C family spore germination protein n=1 Tax=Bacillus sp. FJAT-45350 TaxID=2011014 RepID=UPI000BB85664|nr:Ger(x)C family spore germination protein [Bacillus sp. FJAT-45350]
MSFPFSRTSFSVILISLLLLTGCWDAKLMNEMYYVVAIGVDYDEESEEFITYTQFIDFAAIAAADVGQPSAQFPPWIGRGTGETLDLALSQIYEEAQQRIFWGHMSAIVISESVFKREVGDTLDILIRYPEFRYTPWVFGTEESMMDIFSVTSMYELSPLQTMLHDPTPTFEQSSMIPRVRMNRFFAWLQEPASTLILPNLAISDELYYEETESKEKYSINGAFVIEQGRYKGLLDAEQITGYRWVQDETFRSGVALGDNERPKTTASLISPDIEVTYTEQNGEVFFDLDLVFEANLSEVIKPITEEEVKVRIKKEVEEEVRKTYLEGLKIGADVYQLRERLYRRDVKLWKKLNKEGPFVLNEDSLRNINVDVNLNHTGKLILQDKRLYNDNIWEKIN